MRLLKAGNIGHTPIHPKSAPAPDVDFEPLYPARHRVRNIAAGRGSSHQSLTRRRDVLETEPSRLPSESSIVSLRVLVDNARRDHLLGDNMSRSFSPQSSPQRSDSDEDGCPQAPALESLATLTQSLSDEA